MAPQKPPSSVKVVSQNPDSICVKWRYVGPGKVEEPIKGFKVFLKPISLNCFVI